MYYEWDATKARINLRKHGIDFADAATVFSDDFVLTIEDEHPTEDRFDHRDGCVGQTVGCCLHMAW